MTKQQAIQEIEKYVKPYLSIDMHQATFSQTMRAIKAGTCKPKTEIAFFSRFSIYISKEAEYSFEQFPNGIKLK